MSRVLLPEVGDRSGIDLGGCRWPTTLRCGQVVLRPLIRRDAGRYLQLRARNRHWTGPWDATLPGTSTQPGGPREARGYRDVWAMVHRLEKEAKAGRCLPWAVCIDEAWPQHPTAASRLPMSGQLTVSGIVLGSARFASVGYWIDEAVAGRGIMPTAVALAADHALQVRELHRLEVNIRPDNIKSLAVARTLGLRDEGLRQRYLHVDGAWRDHRCFVADAEDFHDGVLTTLLQNT